MDYGYFLGNPFVDPDEAIRLAREKYPEYLDKARKYAEEIRTRFKRFYPEEVKEVK